LKKIVGALFFLRKQEERVPTGTKLKPAKRRASYRYRTTKGEGNQETKKE